MEDAAIDRAYRIMTVFTQAERDRKAWREFHENANRRLNAAAADWYRKHFQ